MKKSTCFAQLSHIFVKIWIKSVYVSKDEQCKFLHLLPHSIHDNSLQIDFHRFIFSSQIRQTLKKKAFEEAGIPVKQISLVQSLPAQSLQTIPQQSVQIPQVIQVVQTMPQQGGDTILVEELAASTSEAIEQKIEVENEHSILSSMSAEMTLNRLNVQENDMDADPLESSDVKLEFDTEEEAGWNQLIDFFSTWRHWEGRRSGRIWSNLTGWNKI